MSLLHRWEITELTPAMCVQKVVDAVARLAEKEKIFLHKVMAESCKAPTLARHVQLDCKILSRRKCNIWV